MARSLRSAQQVCRGSRTSLPHPDRCPTTCVVLPKLTVRVRLPSSAPTTKALVQPKFCDPSDIGHRHCLVAAPPRLRRRGTAEACSPVDLGSAETTNHRESLCLNAYLMNHGSRSSIRVCLAGVASTVGCRAEMTTSLPWRPSVTEWRQVWRITRLTTCRPPQTLRRQEFPKQSIWRSEGCWTTPQSTRRTADSAVLRCVAARSEARTRVVCRQRGAPGLLVIEPDSAVGCFKAAGSRQLPKLRAMTASGNHRTLRSNSTGG